MRTFRADRGYEYSMQTAWELAESLQQALEQESKMSFRLVKIGRGEFNLIPSI